jgi:hypothetical protein
MATDSFSAFIYVSSGDDGGSLSVARVDFRESIYESRCTMAACCPVSNYNRWTLKPSLGDIHSREPVIEDRDERLVLLQPPLSNTELCTMNDF